MTSLSLIIHGHFYQPPREDPLTDIIPQEPGAYPYPNWNARINAECYRPNALSRNLERISYNFGPTLLPWIERNDPEVYQAILKADYTNRMKYGVGNAIAQTYNHTILPLASQRDKNTQVAWGIADFAHRFGRRPTGMWLPETAVDTETLLTLVDHGIEFVILAPWQANTPNLDPTEPYWISLPGNNRIIAFFYHGYLSGRISFDSGATINADSFAAFDLLKAFNPDKRSINEPQMVMLASDGELYGHHKYQRDRFLAHLVNGASTQRQVEITYPARWLREHTPRHTIALNYDTSWSCHHGIARWATGCNCTAGDFGWKDHLRTALNRLAKLLDDAYYRAVYLQIPEPWELRNRYIEVILGQLNSHELIQEMACDQLDEVELSRIRLLLEAQFERQRMFTSCGWFFDDFNRIEPKNVIAYAAQAVWLTASAGADDLTGQAVSWLRFVISQTGTVRADQVFLHHLARAKSSHLDAPTRNFVSEEFLSLHDQIA